MKRLTTKYRKWLHRRQKYVEKRRTRSESVKVVTVVDQHGARRVFAYANAQLMPEIFCFKDNFEQSAQLLHGLRFRLNSIISGRQVFPKNAGSTPHIGKYIRFDSIESITPSAALVLAAEYDRVRHRTKKNIFVVDIDDWHLNVVVALYELGFFKLLNISRTPPHELENSDVRILPMRSGRTHDPDEIGNLIEGLRELFAKLGLDDTDDSTHLYGVLSEAIENVVHHAYPPNAQFQYPHVQRWWMTGAVERSTRRLTVAIFDQGVSIPGSLKTWRKYASFKIRMQNLVGFVPEATDTTYDGQAIAAALTESASSTEKSNRGKGMSLMKDFIDGCKDGHLRIFSRKGEILYRTGFAPVASTHNVSIGGTLIELDVVI